MTETFRFDSMISNLRRISRSYTGLQTLDAAKGSAIVDMGVLVLSDLKLTLSDEFKDRVEFKDLLELIKGVEVLIGLNNKLKDYTTTRVEELYTLWKETNDEYQTLNQNVLINLSVSVSPDGVISVSPEWLYPYFGVFLKCLIKECSNVTAAHTYGRRLARFPGYASTQDTEK